MKAVIGVCFLMVLAAPSSSAAFAFGELMQMQLLSFHPDTVTVPGDGFAILVVQNREDGPIQHEMASKDLFEAGTLVAVQGTGKIEYSNKRVSRVILDPGRGGDLVLCG